MLTRFAPVFLLSASVALAQQPSTGFHEEVEVRVMDLDVVVTDRAGRPVTDLKREDFTVKVGGKVVPIDYFAKVEEGGILVVGCSTSEVLGKKIGTAGSGEVAAAIYDSIAAFCAARGLYLAAQCCEHLNRSLVVEKRLMKARSLARVNAVPQVHAGGSFATCSRRS